MVPAARVSVMLHCAVSEGKGLREEAGLGQPPWLFL